MSLTERLLDPINGLGLSMEDEFDAVNAIEEIVQDVAGSFLNWYYEIHLEPWAEGLATYELYEQFKQTL